jgi:hypothetical protein
MASHAAPTKRIGYVGGLAVAAGIGAALAVASQGPAHADEKDAGAKTVDAGPKKDATTKVSKPFSKPLSKVGDQAEKAADLAAKKLKALKPTTKPQTAKVKLTAKDFEAQQVKLLKDAFTPKQAAAGSPAIKNNITPSAAKAADTGADTTAAIPGLPDPFRADDPDPDDMPTAILGLRNSFVNGFDPALKPYAREGFEAAYRFSQTVPYLNAVVPITTILPAIGQALNGDAAAKQASQVIVNELLKTTQPVSLLYYGYDELADLVNLESEGTALKQQFYITVWNTLDPLGLLHVKGESGI